MIGFFEYVIIKYGFLGFLCLGITYATVFLLWLGLSFKFIVPFFAPAVFIGWAAYKYWKGRAHD